ncbi:MAG: amidohydrolase family protein [Armatimonadota bacterium]
MNQLWYRYKTNRILPDCPIYDMHGHWGSTPGIALPAANEQIAHTLLRQMGVKRLVFCHHHALFAADIGNDANIAAVCNMPDVLRAYMGINPNYPEEVEKDLARFDDYPDVFVGFKFLAGYHKIALEDERNRPVWEFANARRLPVLMHTWGGSPVDGPANVRKIAERYPDVPLLCGHSFYGDPDSAIELAKTFPNLYLELTAILIERGMFEPLYDGVGASKIVFGTDFPWFSHSHSLGVLLGSGICEEDFRTILYRNARKLLGEPAVD